jgi:tetratricopeptide (TPR) repeat protein
VSALEAEQRVALAWAREHDPELHMRLASALGIFLYHAGRVAETSDELGVAIAACGITGTDGGWAAVVRAFALQSQGEDEQAPVLAEAGLAELRRAEDPLMLELGLRLAGLLWGFAGDPERGLAYATEALALARASGDPTRLVTELLMQGQALVQLGRLDEAEAVFDEAEPLLPLAGDGKLVLGTFRGDVALQRGDWVGAARGYVESALSAHPRSNQVISDLQLIAYALLRLGAIDDALELDAVAAAIGEVTGLRGMEDYFPPGRVDAMREAHARHAERAEIAARRACTVGPERAARRASELVESAREHPSPGSPRA